MSDSLQAASTHAHGYNFHDPEFVDWWLKSLYLLPLEQQVAAAHAIKQVVSVPAVHAEADLFLAEMGEGPLAGAVQVQQTPPAANAEEEPLDVVTGTLRRIWRERPAVIWLGVISLGVLALRGIQALMGLVT